MPIALLSPAKTLDEGECEISRSEMTSPPFADDTTALIECCRGLSKAQIKSLMSLSDPLAKLNFDRFQNFEAQTPKASAWAFDGPAHKALDIASLTKPQQDYAQSHVTTLSGLYGCLRVRDGIRPYACVSFGQPA